MRILPVDRIAMPRECGAGGSGAAGLRLLPDASPAVTIGLWNPRANRTAGKISELLLHQLVHVAQCERFGGLDAFVEHLSDGSSATAPISLPGLLGGRGAQDCT